MVLRLRLTIAESQLQRLLTVSRVTEELLSRRSQNKSSRIQPSSRAYVWFTRDALRTWHICSVASSQSTRFSISWNWNSSGTNFLCRSLNFIHSINYFIDEPAAIAFQSKTLFTESPNDMNSALLEAVSKSTRKDVSIRRLVLRMCIAVDPEIGN